MDHQRQKRLAARELTPLAFHPSKFPASFLFQEPEPDEDNGEPKKGFLLSEVQRECMVTGCNVLLTIAQHIFDRPLGGLLVEFKMISSISAILIFIG